MKILRWVVPALIVLALATTFSLLTVSAAPPPNADPSTATYIDNQPHTIPGNAVQWYKFDYYDDGASVTVTLEGGAGQGLRFDVFTPNQAQALTNEKPIGKGTLKTSGCASGLPLSTGGCWGDNIEWMGRMPDTGTFLVELFNENPQAANFTMTVAGDSVSNCVPAGQVATSVCGAGLQPTVVPPPLPPTNQPNIEGSNPNPPPPPPPVNAPNSFYTDPYHAKPLTDQIQTIAPNSSIWYRFEYVGDGSDIVLRIPNGVYTPLGFSVYTPDQAATWYNESPIGRGTVSACGVERLDNPDKTCGPNANDTIWSGKFFNSGTYFVQVTNPSGGPIQFVLSGSGTGLSVCAPGQVNPVGNGYLPCP